ncbi:hypothetical protein FOC4_g10004928 [Fusarium odoratissimum]|uniref:C2H2-type domain-containing protein n=1 Tax=Fusarium oxysporum f. sp. cubense (strain race 4) TaxID=2502994 RepID=N1RQE8_FUSC4|nr:hypothetical protein FOC4_g10004928 [Fusarium odoratissimum]
MSSIEPSIKIKAETSFDWIKHAAEPLSPEALIDALAVHMTDDKDIVLEDLDKEAEMAELIKAFGGIITVENGDVKFSHPTFYQVIRLDQDAKESTARINSSMAAACLRYFQFENAQKTLTELCSANFEGSSLETPLDIVVTSHQRTTFAEYAVRFWPHHYKVSEQFSPKQLVHELFDSKLSRAAWEVSFWLLSNPFTRINRHYISTLPVFAMLGLEDLLDEKMNSEMSHPWFNDNCWLSITEAIRSGEKSIAKKLLDQVDVNEDELQTSLFWAAAQDDRETLDALISKIPDLKTFPWPETFMHRLTSTGQDTLLATVLASGSDINNTGPYWGCPPTLIAAWRNRVSTLDLILRSEPKPDLTIEDNTGDNLLIAAVRLGNPEVVKLIVDAGADLKNGRKAHDLVRAAVRSGSHEVVGILLEAGAKVEMDAEDEQSPLSLAAANGLLECVRVLLDHKADPNANSSAGTALYAAVEKEHLDIVRFLLEHDPKPNIHSADKFGRKPIHFAASNPYERCLVYLLETLGKTDVDVKDHDQWTILMWAARSGEFNSVETLLERGADIWARSRSSEQRTEWSPLKLANFAGRSQWITDLLVPKELSRTKGDGSQEEWDEYFHKCKVGDDKRVICDSCLVLISGLRWDCIECNDSFSLCFKCVPHKSDLHNPEHSFRDIGPLYETESVAGSVRSDSSQELAPAKEEDGNSESSAGIDLQNLELDLED